MKEVAGYHLFIDLVMNLGFPRERILFCSNHGNHLDSINNSFEPAKIEAPAIFTKKDDSVKQWIADQAERPFLKLRRWVILACEDLLARVRHGHTRFTMCDLPLKGEAYLTSKNAEILLETLPKLLPAQENSEFERKLVFRLFARTLTQNWEMVDYKNNEKPLKQPVKAFANVLVNVRNWTSHDAKALTEMDEGIVAFLFLIAMRSCFELANNKLEDFEKALLPLIGETVVLDMSKLVQDYTQSSDHIEKEYLLLGTKFPQRHFASRVNLLHQSGKISPDAQADFLCQILWHELHWAKEKVFSPQPEYFNKPTFLDHLTRRIYRRSFPSRMI